MSQHAYKGFAKRQSRSRSGFALGVTAVGVAVILASISGLWLLRSVRHLNRQVARLNRQTEQLNRRLQGAEQQVNALDQKASQDLSAQTAALRSDQRNESQATSAVQAQTPSRSEAAPQQPANQAAQKAEGYRKARDEELQKLQRSLGQIAETHRTAAGLLTTLGAKSLRFASGKSDIAPQYRATRCQTGLDGSELCHIAGDRNGHQTEDGVHAGIRSPGPEPAGGSKARATQDSKLGQVVSRAVRV